MSERLRVVVTDPIISGFADELRRTAREHEWHLTGDAPDTAHDALATADVVVCARMSQDEAMQAGRARLVHATGAGVDRIATASLAPEVAVCNTGHHGDAIAEHVMMTALMLRRRALEADAQMRAGEWRTVATTQGTPFHRTLAGSTIGILGFGEIGRSVARRAAGFGMRIVATRRRPDAGLPDDLPDVLVRPENELHRVLAESDIVVVTVPLNDATRGLIGRDAIAAMRRDALLINVARGPVVDEDALHDALREERIGGAAIDVWWGAPDGVAAPPAVARFAPLKNTVLTPHFSGHARDVFERRATDIAHNIDLLAEGRPLERRVL